jgi:hypothetical protein
MEPKIAKMPKSGNGNIAGGDKIVGLITECKGDSP